MNNNNRNLLAVILAVVVVGLVGAAVYGMWSVQRKTNDAPVSTQTESLRTTGVTTDKKTDSEKTTDDTGTITGGAVYPSEGYPADYKVCIVSATSGAEIVCDTAMAGKTGAQDYKVTVTPGIYKVLAKSGTMTGYYDTYMKDGHYKTGDVDLCDAQYHTPLTLEVTAGKEITGVDAGNFYYTPANCTR